MLTRGVHVDPMQLVDELCEFACILRAIYSTDEIAAMIYTVCFSCYASFSYRRSRLYALWVAISLSSLAIFITAYYHYLQDPSFHQNAYALLTATVLLRGMYVMEVNLRPSLQNRQREHISQQSKGVVSEAERKEQKRQDARDELILKNMWTMIAYGLSIFLGGFAIWTLDNRYCSTLRRWRRDIGLPWGILLEGHGWWHLMTGLFYNSDEASFSETDFNT